MAHSVGASRLRRYWIGSYRLKVGGGVGFSDPHQFGGVPPVMKGMTAWQKITAEDDVRASSCKVTGEKSTV